MHLYFSIFVLIAGLLGACNSPQKHRFSREDGQASGFVFLNEIQEDSIYNALDFTNLYTGSGVGIGDVNNDGLADIFMGACMNSSKFFLNKGNMKFEDLTLEMGLETDRWITGVAMVDINQDTWLDIYLSVSGPPGSMRENLLFVNQEGKAFKEMAADYGINESAQCTQASFFDYDKDGDLDLYLAVNPTDYTIFNVNTIRKRKLNGEAASTDKLYRNNGNLTFTDISREAGILVEGYSLGLNVSDINGDHWPDVYVTNDFLSNDILYINQKDGTFIDQSAAYFKHTSFASMGIDVADVNNDALPDIYVLDMFPEDNFRQKMLMPGADYDRFQYTLRAGYNPQYTRNTLQLNNGNESFSEIGQLANIHKTDWSWSALLADFDNDAWRDVFVGNGFLRDMGDLDYINFNKFQAFGTKEVVRKRQLELIQKQQSIKIPNYMFVNEGGIRFNKVSEAWGFQDATCSNGAAYGDLDLDGDLDLVVNNLNQPSFLYENHSNELDENHYLKINLVGKKPNINAIGAKLWLYAGDQKWYHEHLPFRGYESSMDPIIHMGLGSNLILDSLVVLWPDLSTSKWENLRSDSLYQLSHSTNQVKSFQEKSHPVSTPFRQKNILAAVHKEDHQVDFYFQSLLPHQYSQLGPALTTADINGDGLEDVFLGGAAGQAAQLLLQKPSGGFSSKTFELDEEHEDIDALFFDADGDQDMDLYVVSGGSNLGRKDYQYQDRLYINDGAGNLEKHPESLPHMNASGATVKASDFDQDGDMDLFVGGRWQPGKYPIIPPSFFLENQQGQFVDITQEKAPDLANIGMVTDAEWTDVDQDGKEDLVIVGEWMAIKIYKNYGDRLGEMETKGLEFSSGWWNAIEAADFDKDGDMDFLVGNLGLNTNYRADSLYPLCVYAKDFDDNGSIDPIMCQFIKGVEYPIVPRDKLIKQLPFIEARFSTYHSYAQASFQEVFSESELKDALRFKSYTLQSSYIENLGDGTFVLKPLDITLQTAPITDIWIEDFNQDGNMDALMVGNSYATEVKTGRYDAFTGAYLEGTGMGKFEIKSGAESGFLANKAARKIAKIDYRRQDNTELYLVSNNSDSLQVFVHTTN